MAPQALTIRNVTTMAMELKLLERFEATRVDDPPQSRNSLANLTRKFSGAMNTLNIPSSHQLAAKSESFSHEDVTILIGPLETKPTDIQTKSKEVLRLTFEVEGERYRIDTPTPSQRSAILIPLSPSPRYEFTAVYLPKEAFLTLYSSAKLESWMSNLKDETPLSALSIPGTHNSPTCHMALPSVRCQAVSVKEQLENGVRFLDIRVQPESSDRPSERLVLVHSAFPISLTGHKYFRDLVKVVLKFLENNPSETVIMSLKREGVGKTTDQQLSKTLHDHYATDPASWFTENRIPALGEVRKKIIIVRRFCLDDSLRGENNGAGWCIDAESWPDNCTDGICSSGEIRVQDFYEVGESENIEKKIQLAKDQLERAAQAVCVFPTGDMAAASEAAAKQPFFINFLSASNFWKSNCWPDKIAAKVNPKLVDFLCRSHNESSDHGGDGGTGIVVCDWVGNNGDWDLIRCIVGMNAKLEFKGR